MKALIIAVIVVVVVLVGAFLALVLAAANAIMAVGHYME